MAACGGETLPQVKCLGVLFTSEGRLECEIDGRVSVPACLEAPSWSVVVKMLKDKALDLPIDHCSHPHLWS